MKKINYPHSNRLLKLTAVLFIACASYCQAQYYNQNALTLPAQYIKNPYTVNAASYTSVPGGYNFNAIITGDLTVSSGETEGRLLVGKNFTVGTTTGAGCFDGGDYTYATSTNTSGLGQPAQSGNFHNIIVGSNFTIQNSTGPDMQQANWALNGVAIYGGTISPSSFATQNADYQVPGVIPSATAIKTYYQNLSSTYAGLTTTGTVTYGVFTPTVLNGGNASLTQYVFNVNYNSMDTYAGITLQNVNPNASILINLTGAPAISLGSGGKDFTISGLTAVQTREHVLVNLPTATQFNFTSTQMDVSLLVPAANAKFQGGVLNGMVVIGGDVTACQGFEFHNSMSSVVISQPILAISGNVFNDANGLTDNTVNGTGVNGPSVGGAPLYVSLVSGGAVIATVPVTSTGTYSFSNVAAGSYSVVLTTSAAGSTTPSLPASWTSTGENLGTAAGSDGTPNGILPVTVGTTSVSNANFGIEQRPTVTPGTNAAQANPGGSVAAPVSPSLFTGTDPEDGTYPTNLTGRTVTLTPATNGTLYYNGTAVTTTTVIPSFDPTKVTLDPTATGATTGTGGAAPDPTFTYTVKDNAGVESLPATIRVPFTAALPVSLVSFTAKAQADQSVLLEWITSLETKNKGFLIERSKDLTQFEKVGEVSEVAASSNALKTYHLIDAAPYSGTSYYRLSQTDLDGTTTRYPAISVVVRGEAYGIFPNPVKDGQFTLNLDEPLTATVNLYSADGRPVGLHKTGSTDSSLHLKATQPLATGVYVLSVQERGQTRQYRIVIN